MESSTALKRTPLYEEHVAAGARIVPFAGWEMPVQYEGVAAEHDRRLRRLVARAVVQLRELGVVRLLGLVIAGGEQILRRGALALLEDLVDRGSQRR